jgi:endogenous inhibitor of DNA gyrase (YacG/DUF329 family)
MKAVNCPICKKLVQPGEPRFPFCSERCRLIDLGNWLGGKYHVPGEPAPVDERDPGKDDGDK